MGTIVLIAASAIWGMVHSILASHWIKDGLRHSLGTGFMRWYRFLYNGFSAVTFLPLIVMAQLLPDQALYSIPAPWLYLALLVQFAAVVTLLVGLLQTDVWGFIGLRQLVSGEQAIGSLVTSGLYRLVRHPLYTSGLVILWLAPQMTLNRLVLIISLTIYIVIGAIFEERKLLREFGSVYAEYSARTPMFIPGLRPRRLAANY
jgi:methanethiol S-methyltransferase